MLAPFAWHCSLNRVGKRPLSLRLARTTHFRRQARQTHTFTQPMRGRYLRRHKFRLPTEAGFLLSGHTTPKHIPSHKHPPLLSEKVRRARWNLRPFRVRQVLSSARPGQGRGVLPGKRPRGRGGHQAVPPRAAAFWRDRHLAGRPPIFWECPRSYRSSRPG